MVAWLRHRAGCWEPARIPPPCGILRGAVATRLGLRAGGDGAVWESGVWFLACASICLGVFFPAGWWNSTDPFRNKTGTSAACRLYHRISFFLTAHRCFSVRTSPHPARLHAAEQPQGSTEWASLRRALHGKAPAFQELCNSPSHHEKLSRFSTLCGSFLPARLALLPATSSVLGFPSQITQPTAAAAGINLTLLLDVRGLFLPMGACREAHTRLPHRGRNSLFGRNTLSCL